MENNLKNGKCRFCFAKGNHRDIMKVYKRNGISEVYSEIIQECFNLFLCTNAERSSLICLLCIEKLRGASDFRSMVFNAEKQLTDTLNAKETHFVNCNLPTEMILKQETEEDIKPEVHNSDHEEVDDHNGLHDFDDNSMESVEVDELVLGEAELLAKFKTLKPLPSRVSLARSCREFAKHLDILRGQKITPKSIEKLLAGTKYQDTGLKVFITEKIAHINNITNILENSNLTAFKRLRRSRLPCFYCMRQYENFETLREHQENEKCNGNMKKMFSKITPDCLVVYVMYNILKCTLCEQIVKNLNDLKAHLSKSHSKTFHPEFGDRIVPFKLTEENQYICEVCSYHSETFGSMERHMNVHFRNFVCDKCGAGYITKNRLKVHLKCSHVTGEFPCSICKKVYNTHYKYKCHYDIVHKMVKKNRCHKCPARFSDYFERHRHMSEVHGDPLLRFKCNVCDAEFKRRYALSCHMKRRHLEVRDVQCTQCTYTCYTYTELRAHMVKHNGERTNECVVCKKSYARKKTLKEHMRIHNNDRRYVCALCGQAFVQNCSLKGHMKAHHSDYYNNLPQS